MRIALNLSSFFQDHRAFPRIFLGDEIRCVKDVKKHISKVFKIYHFHIFCDNYYLPSSEDIRIINTDDVLRLIPKTEPVPFPQGVIESNRAGTESLTLEKIKPSCKPKKRKLNIPLEKPSTIVETSEAFPKSKKRRKEVINDEISDLNRDKSSEIRTFLENAQDELKKKKALLSSSKPNQFNFREYTAVPITKPSKKINIIKTVIVSKNGDVTTEYPSNNKDSIVKSSEGNVANNENDGVEITTECASNNEDHSVKSAERTNNENDGGDITTEYLSNNEYHNVNGAEENVAIDENEEEESDDNTVETSITSEFGTSAKRKRKRIRKRKKRSVNTNVNTGITPGNFIPRALIIRPQNATHIKFTSDNEIEKVSNEEEKSETVNEMPQNREIGPVNNEACNSIVDSVTSLNVEVGSVYIMNAGASNSSQASVGNPQLNGFTEPKVDTSNSTPISQEPNIGDVVSFKILRITENYTPEISSEIVGTVISFDAASQEVTFSIKAGLDQCSEPSGKFSLYVDDETDEVKARRPNHIKSFLWNDLHSRKILNLNQLFQS